MKLKGVQGEAKQIDQLVRYFKSRNYLPVAEALGRRNVRNLRNLALKLKGPSKDGP
jgi:hypothetical protein